MDDNLIKALETGLKAVQALARSSGKKGNAFAEMKFINDASFIQDAIDGLKKKKAA